MRGQSKFTIVKKSEPIIEASEDQIGSGMNLDPSIQKSFQHPIVTDSIILTSIPKETVTKTSEAKRKLEDFKPTDANLKKKKLSHKFAVV